MKPYEMISSLIESREIKAFTLRTEEPANLSNVVSNKYSKKLQNDFEKQCNSFKILFEDCVSFTTNKLGDPNSIYREHSENCLPWWAPCGVYADWPIEQEKIFCIFMAMGSNPEEDLVLAAGVTTQDAKEKREDPWSYQWLEPQG